MRHQGTSGHRNNFEFGILFMDVKQNKRATPQKSKPWKHRHTSDMARVQIFQTHSVKSAFVRSDNEIR